MHGKNRVEPVIENQRFARPAVARPGRAGRALVARVPRAVRAAGFEIPDGIAQPVLIARRQGSMDPDQRRTWVRDNNRSAVMRMSASEDARVDANLLDDALMGLYQSGSDIYAQANDRFRRAFLARLNQSERAQLVTAKGNLNRQGADRIRFAIFQAAWRDNAMIERIAELDDPDFAAMTRALSDVAPDWAALRADIEAGRVQPQYDISAEVLEAVRLIADAREEARTGRIPVQTAIRDALAQIDAFKGAVSPLVERLVAVFFRPTASGGMRARAQGDVAEILTAYVREAREIGTTAPALLPTEPISPGDTVNAIVRRKDDPRYVGTDDGAGAGNSPDSVADGGPRPDSGGGQPGGRGDQGDPGPHRPADDLTDAGDEAGLLPDLFAPLDDIRPPPDLGLDPALTRAGAHAPAIIAADDAILDDLRRAFEAAKREPDRAAALERNNRELERLKLAQPADTLDALYALAPQAQVDLVAALRRAADPLGIGIKDPGLKRRSGEDSAETKMARKGYATAREMTDIVRAGFAVERAEEADKVLAALRGDFEVLDEGWSINRTGFVDRKLIVRTSSGLLAEVQVWPAGMATAKFDLGGQALYKQRRGFPAGPEEQALAAQEAALYRDAIPEMDPSFAAALGSAKSPNLQPKAARNSASERSILPVSPTSIQSTSTQSEPGFSSATADSSNSIAGRESQSTNHIPDPPVSDTSTLAPSGLKINEGPADADFPVEFDAEGNPTRMASDILADLDADAEFAEVIQLCAVNRGIVDG